MQPFSRSIALISVALAVEAGWFVAGAAIGLTILKGNAASWSVKQSHADSETGFLPISIKIGAGLYLAAVAVRLGMRQRARAR